MGLKKLCIQIFGHRGAKSGIGKTKVKCGLLFCLSEGQGHPPGSISKARLKRALKFSRAIAAVSSTSCSGESFSDSRRKRSSGTRAGVELIASAYERISFSRSVKISLSR